MSEAQVEVKQDRAAEKLKALGIDPALVEKWKATHGKVELVMIQGKPYIYRGLPRIEFKQLTAKMREMDNLASQETIAGRCVLWPQDFGAQLALLPSGVPATLADKVIALSGFGADEEPLEL